jgi:hypothetical protein
MVGSSKCKLCTSAAIYSHIFKDASTASMDAYNGRFGDIRKRWIVWVKAGCGAPRGGRIFFFFWPGCCRKKVLEVSGQADDKKS